MLLSGGMSAGDLPTDACEQFEVLWHAAAVIEQLARWAKEDRRMEAERRTPDRDVLGSSPDGRASSEWQVLGSVTIDTATLLLIDPVHAGANVGTLSESDYVQVPIPGGDFSAVLVLAGMGDGRYPVEGRFADCPFGRRLSEIRVRFLDDGGNWLGGDGEKS